MRRFRHIWTGGLGLYVDALGYYSNRLERDIAAIREKTLLAQILPTEIEGEFELFRHREIAFEIVGELRGLMVEAPSWTTLRLPEGYLGFVRAATDLYLGALRRQRNQLSQRPGISLAALDTVDYRIDALAKELADGPFSKIEASPLLVEQVEEIDHGPAIAAESGRSRVTDAAPSARVFRSIEILDHALRSRCIDLFDQFSANEESDRFDTIIRESTTILEDRLRRAAGAQSGLSGVDLVKEAFSKDNAKVCLSDVAAEQEAAHLLFRGVVGYIRNPPHHRLAPEFDAARTLQIVALIDYLLGLIDRGRVDGDSTDDKN